MYDRREVYSFSSFWLSISIRCRIRDVLVKFINIVGPVGLWTFFFSFHAVFVEICKKVGLKVRRQPTATGTGVQKIDLLSMEVHHANLWWRLYQKSGDFYRQNTLIIKIRLNSIY
ncbi:hypothetical protein AAZX31_17G236700 [Glycine max]